MHAETSQTREQPPTRTAHTRFPRRDDPTRLLVWVLTEVHGETLPSAPNVLFCSVEPLCANGSGVFGCCSFLRRPGGHDHMKTSQTRSPTELHRAQSIKEHTILESRSLENIHSRFLVQRLNRKKHVIVYIFFFLK